MAYSQNNVLIIPNVGVSTDVPQIIFTSSNLTSTGTITLRAYPNNNGTLSFEGSSGQLFSINNSLVGTLFSVNDISGIPSITVADSGLVQLAPYNGYVTVGSNILTTGTSSGALVVSGGVGVSGGMYVGGAVTGTNIVATSAIAAASNAGAITALSGGISANSMYSQNGLSMANSTNLSSSALQLYNINSNFGTNLATVYNYGISYRGAGSVYTYADTGVNTSFHLIQGPQVGYSSGVGVWTNVATLRLDPPTLYNTATTSITNLLSLLATGGISITTSTASTSTNSGALQVAGGVGIGGNLFVGGVITATSGLYAASPNAILTVGTNLGLYPLTFTAPNSSGRIAQFLGNSDASIAVGAGLYTTSMGANSTNGYISVLQNQPLVLQTGNTTRAQIDATGVVTVYSTASSTSTTTGALVVAGGVGIGGNLYVGGTIYQNGVAVGSTTSTSSATVVVFNNTFSSTLQYLAFVGTSTGTANALQVSAPNGLVYQPSTGYVGIGTTATTATLTLVGSSYIIGASTQTGIMSILNSTGATSTSSGALVVTGGAGIGGALYVGGAIYSSGTQITSVSPPINLTASQGQTTFVVPGGYNTVTMVFANGVLLNQSDYTASTSPNVILNIARNAGDTITIVFGQSVATPISQVASAAAMAMVLGI